MVFLLKGCLPSKARRRGRQPLPHAPDLAIIPTYRSVPRQLNPLLTACWNQEWESVQDLLDSYPEDTYYKTDHTGRTPLHLATMPGTTCPAPLVRRMIHANPHAVVECDRHQFGGTPLHFVCGSHHVHDSNLVQLLVQAALDTHAQFPQSIPTLRIHGWSPFLLACRKNPPIATILIFLRVQNTRPDGLWMVPCTGGETYLQITRARMSRDQTSQSPLNALYYSSMMEHAIVLPEFGVHFSDLSTLRDMTRVLFELDYETISTLKEHPDPTVSMWTKCLLILRQHVDDLSFLVHALACLHFPVTPLLKLACVLFPEQAFLCDANGRLPLHLALVEQWKEWQGTMEVLIATAPETVSIVDPVSGLIPACLASASAMHHSHLISMEYVELEIVFRLLRTDPTSLRIQQEFFRRWKGQA
jgi:hypothetical protein|uniref:Ankyrin n=1 Tax=Phaeodactylum tricornutum TaxID=2850 RepID=A0A8J9SUU8_PHATR